MLGGWFTFEHGGCVEEGLDNHELVVLQSGRGGFQSLDLPPRQHPTGGRQLLAFAAATERLAERVASSARSARSGTTAAVPIPPVIALNASVLRYRVV